VAPMLETAAAVIESDPTPRRPHFLI
jgi:hypothetical protein